MAGEREGFLDYLEREGFTQEQREAILAPCNVIVEAGAGTGKTKTLVARYLFHVLVEGFSPSQVVALTFTEKAAQEMKDRVAQELGKFLGTSLESRALRALEAVVHAPIKTFHGFAAYLLREYPVETGVDPAFSVLDEMGEGLLLEEAINGYLSAHLDSPALSHLLSRWNIFQLKRSLRIFFTSIVSESEWDEVERAALEAFSPRPSFPQELEKVRALLALKGEVEKLLVQGRCPGLFPKVLSSMEMLEYLFSRLSHEEDPVPVLTRIARELENFPSWGRCRYLRELEALKRLAPLVWEWLETREGEGFYRSFMEVARGVGSTLVRMKTREGVLSFSDLQKGLIRGLRRNRGLVEELKDRFRRLLVDEYQDTNEFQREVVCRICEERGEYAPRYQEAGLEDGKLFIVGDPKQSIYAFRGGDVAVYARTKVQLGEGAAKLLSRSFRSGSSLVEAVNALFPKVFSPSVPLPEEYVVPFSPLTTLRGGGEVWVWRLEEGEDYLQAVSRLVLGLEERRGRWGDIALLVRRNATAVELYRHLSSLNIPLVSSTTGSLEERREVQDLLLYLKALDNPADNYSVAGVLLAPFVGVSHGTLLKLSSKGVGLYRAWQEAVKSSTFSVQGSTLNIEQGDLEALAHGLEVFQGLMEKKDKLTISGLIQEVVKSTGYGAWLARQPCRDQALANLDRLARVARRFQKGRLFTLSEFLIYLDHWGLSSREVQEGVEGGNAVAILTVHAAKGLEFPVVILAETWSRFRRNNDPVLYDPRKGFAIKLPGVDTVPHYGEVKAVKDAKGWEEEKRLLYVAFTRAMDEVHLILKSGGHRGQTWHSLLKEAGVEGLARKGEWEKLPPEEYMESGEERERERYQLPLDVGAGGGLEIGVRHLLGHHEGEEGGVGALLHRALKEISHPREASEWYRLHASSFNFQGTTLSKRAFVAMIRDYFASSLYREVVAKARRLYRELPLEAFYKSIKVKGRLDLLAVMEDGSLVLVEYKLDRSLVARGGYIDQLALYAWLVEQHAGRWPHEAYLYYLTSGTRERVDVGDLGERALALLEDGYIKLIGDTT